MVRLNVENQADVAMDHTIRVITACVPCPLVAH